MKSRIRSGSKAKAGWDQRFTRRLLSTHGAIIAVLLASLMLTAALLPGKFVGTRRVYQHSSEHLALYLLAVVAALFAAISDVPT